ncbi:MAG: helix-turn-helix transcriptional regulator [Clostridia bacterium]|nr:helix-turn-helix transcriptional regulator [Clostridia bacterium]
MEEMPSCEFLHAHDHVVEEIRGRMPSEDRLFDLAELFRIFGDSTRIKILYALHEHELCVCDIAALLGMTVSAISHQLRILKSAKLVNFRREGKTVFYALADSHVHAILGQGMEHACEDDQISF